MMRTRLVPLVLATAALLVAASCSSDGTTEPSASGEPGPTTSSTSESTSTVPDGTDAPVTTAPRPQGFTSANLEFFGDCDALLLYMQTEASERVTAWGLGGGGIYYGDGPVFAGDDMAETDDAAGGVPDLDIAPGAPVQGQDYSGTNVQEVGVDEGDIVETDGEFVYVASTDGVRVVSVTDAEVTAELELPQGSHQMLLDGDRLVVVTSSWGGAPDTIVSLFDVADPTKPALLRRPHLEGGVVATRSVDGVARLVITTSFDQRLPFVQPNQFGMDEESALERNKEIIAESTVEDWLPRWFDEDPDGGVRDDGAGTALRDGGRTARVRRPRVSRGSLRSTSAATARRSARLASCRPVTPSTHRPTTSTWPRRTGTGAGRSRCRSTPTPRPRRYPPDVTPVRRRR